MSDVDGPVASAIARHPLVARLRRRLALSYVGALERRRSREAARRQRPWQLGGACGGCAACCEEPAIAVGAVVFFVPPLRALFVGWQRVVNGFHVVGADRAARALSFSCAWFDRSARRCRDYEHRPGVCRDYPRMQLDVADPAFFAGCGFHAVATNGEAMVALLQANGVDGDQLVQITRKLRLRPPSPSDRR